MLRELADAVVGLLRQNHAGFGPLQRGLAGSDHLCARANFDIGELRLSDDLGGERLLILGKRFRIIDLDQHGAGRNILAALDGNLGDTPIELALRCRTASRPPPPAPKAAGPAADNRSTGRRRRRRNEHDDDRRTATRSRCRLLGRMLRRLRRGVRLCVSL